MPNRAYACYTLGMPRPRYRSSSRLVDPADYDSIHLLAAGGHLDELRKRHAKGVPMDEVDEKGDTPLLYAVFQCQGDTWRWLLSVGADPTHANAKGDTVIHHLTRRFVSGGVEATLADFDDLVAAGAPVDQPNRAGYSPVMLEARRGQDLNTSRDVAKQPRLALMQRMTHAGADLLRQAPDGLGLSDILDNDDRQRMEASAHGRLIAEQRMVQTARDGDTPPPARRVRRRS